jgi:hypothetical protein
MADINKFLRSKDRLTEIHNYLINNNAEDLKTNSYIDIVEESIRVIDNKMEEFKKRDLIND